MEGNKAWVGSNCQTVQKPGESLVERLVTNPFKRTQKKALIISCARSVAPMDSIFGTDAGDLQVVRVVGNVCTSNDGVLGSVEYALDSAEAPPLVMVMGNSNNAAVTDAVRKAMTEAGRTDLPSTRSGWGWFSKVDDAEGSSALVDEIIPAARDALMSEPNAPFERLCELAAKYNVWRTVETLVTKSTVVHAAIMAGKIQVHGAYFDIGTGKVKLLGEHPKQNALLAVEPKRSLVRDAAAPEVPAEEAYALMVAGNARYASGCGGKLETADESLLLGLSEGGQNPISIVLGCADSRAPVELIFDMKPGDLFILRNAGNTVQAAKGSVIGSAEYSVANLKTKNLIVLGHHKCGAITAAVQTVHAAAEKREDGTYDLSVIDLEAVPGSIGDVLRDILEASAQAIEAIPDASMAEQITLGVHYNVTYTIEKIIKFSPIIRDGIVEGKINIYGGVYDIITGKIEFTGQHPELERILDRPMPFHQWKVSPYQRSTADTQLSSSAAQEAMWTLMDGNKRFVANTPQKPSYDFGGMIGKSASDIDESDPVALVVGGAEVTVPIEKIFDAQPGSLIVQRSMGNIAGRAGGTLFNSLEYAVQKWKPKVLVVMGDSHSDVIEDSFKQLSGDLPPSDAQASILQRTMVSALRSQEQMTSSLTTEAAQVEYKREVAVELNALYTIEQLLSSPIVAKAVKEDGLELHAAMLNGSTGEVAFLGQHPMQEALLGWSPAPKMG